MRIFLLACFALAATVACGAYSFPGSSPAASPGVVTGRVVAVPCTPIEPAAETCAGRPVSGLELDFANGSETRKTVTDSAGDYSIRLDAGTWKVQLQSRTRILSGPASIDVPAGGSVVANYTIDSGIRAPVPPVPQQ